MKMFTTVEKHQVVKRYLTGTISYRDLAKQVGVDNSVLRYWVKLVEYHGEQAFAFPYTNYPAAFKLKVIQFIEEKGYSIREASAFFHIPDFSMVRRWKNKWELGGIDALQPTEKGQFTMKPTKKDKNTKGSFGSIEKELEYLRMENAYLKKLNALVQEKEKSQKKTK